MPIYFFIMNLKMNYVLIKYGCVNAKTTTGN